MVETRKIGEKTSPFLLTLKFLALILFLSCRFSLLLIFLYSSGLGRQSSLSLSSTFPPGSLCPSPEAVCGAAEMGEVGEEEEEAERETDDFLIPPEATVPLRAFPFPPTLTGAMVMVGMTLSSSSSSSSSSAGPTSSSCSEPSNSWSCSGLPLPLPGVPTRAGSMLNNGESVVVVANGLGLLDWESEVEEDEARVSNVPRKSYGADEEAPIM